MDRRGLFSEINKNMTALFGSKLKKILLYGSYAKNKQTKESDIDFFVLVDDTEENLRKNRYQIADVMTQLSLNYDVLVSISEETLERFMEYSQILPFYTNVKNEGIVIMENRLFDLSKTQLKNDKKF